MKRREHNEALTTYAYDAGGRVISETQADATNPVNPVILSSTSYVYDQYGRQIETIDALNQSTHTVYDLRGSVVRQHGATYPVWYEYDTEGRMTAMATTRDAALDPATVDSLDHPSLDVTRWNYDPATGLLTQKLYDDGKGPTYTYTPDGKLATRTWARGVVTEYVYDEAGELASIQYSDGTLPILKTYNRMGHPVSIISAGTTNIFEYSATTLEKISDTQLGYEIRRAHDNLGRMETLSISNLYDGAYAYDAFGRMAEVSFEGLDFHYAYLPGSDLVNGLTYGAVEKTVAFEAHRNLVTGISYHTVADTLIAERTYTYNALGNVVARTRQRGADPVETDDFDHNLRSELIAASLGGTNAVSGDYGYAYDPIGNRVVSTNRSDVTAYASNELNQYTNIISDAPFTPEFDDDGNQILVKTSTGIWHVTYNAENRPVVWSNATSVIAMDYDFMGRRISKRLLAGGGETVDRQFLYDGYLQISAIETNALVSTTFWDPTERIATRPLAMKTVGGVFTYTHDLTKNVMEVLDPGGEPVVVYDYDAFGAVTASRPYVNRFGFSSEYYDSELGCVYYNYRHYNPLDGRWTGRDPIGEARGRCLYVAFNNSALSHYDMLGREVDMSGFREFPPFRTYEAFWGQYSREIGNPRRGDGVLGITRALWFYEIKRERCDNNCSKIVIVKDVYFKGHMYWLDIGLRLPSGRTVEEHERLHLSHATTQAKSFDTVLHQIATGECRPVACATAQAEYIRILFEYSYTIAKYDGATIDVEDYAGDIAIIQEAAAQYQEAVNKMEVAGGAYQVAADKMAKACERAFHE